MTNISCFYSVEFSKACIKIFYIIYTFQIISYFLFIILYFFFHVLAKYGNFSMKYVKLLPSLLQ